ncbi:MAG: putative transcriptional regulator YvhJ [bacterium ADurb.Bin236]|nr:MAG: putative transcriptional regulator YvhJ [bacterium ADurb.Bin236]HOY62151.1 LCP family protein [bacterium]HPN95557.1 LCP family protein [bacterium]
MGIMKGENRKKCLGMIAGLAAAVIAIGGCSKAGKVEPAKEPPAQVEQEEERQPEEAVVVEQSVPEPAAALLIAGLDKYGRPDALMAVAVSPNKKAIGVMSIPRDAMLDVAGKRQRVRFLSKVDGSVAEAVGGLLGLKIDNRVILDLGAAEKVIDAVGGVDIDVEADLRYADSKQGLDINIKKGRQRLNGENAVKYARYKKGSDESGRVDRQQKLAAAVMVRLASPDVIKKAPELVKTLVERPVIKTNMGASDFLTLTTTLSAAGQGARAATLPGDWKKTKEGNHIEPDAERARAAMAKLLAEE